MRLRSMLPVLLLALPPVHAGAAAGGRPYTVDVWSSVLFDAEGRATEIRIVDEGKHPPAFIAQVRQRLQNARIEPRRVDDRAVTFRTGVRIEFEVTPTAGSGTVRVAGMQLAPLPVQSYFFNLPEEIARAAGWEGAVTVVCNVTPAGRCGSTEVRAQAGIPESARRWASASFERWRFEPQQLDGVAIAGEYGIKVHMQTPGPALEDFRQDKFDRVINSR